MKSIRRRALTGAAIWSAVVLLLGGLGLFSLLSNLSLQRFDASLSDRHLQVVVALGNLNADPQNLDAYLTDPAYVRPYSGRYWQVTSDDGTVFTSRSLFDAVLEPGSDPDSAPRFWEGAGPQTPVRGIVQTISFENGANRTVVVAESTESLMQERRYVRQSLLIAFAAIASLAIAAAALQVSVVLRPLSTLRTDIEERWSSAEGLDPKAYPSEVAPLVADLQSLIERNKGIISRARRQAADMAHALKTPSAILRNELDRVGDTTFDTRVSLDALNRIDAQVTRSLARIRAANQSTQSHEGTNLRHSVHRLLRLFERADAARKVSVQVDVAAEMSVRIDRQDLEEILGNLLENAFRWAGSRIRVSSSSHADSVEICVEDDGPGIPEEARKKALLAGERLDLRAKGTGLGLAIVSDLATAYGGRIDLGKSEALGGLAARLHFPYSPVLERENIGI